MNRGLLVGVVNAARPIGRQDRHLHIVGGLGGLCVFCTKRALGDGDCSCHHLVVMEPEGMFWASR